MDPFFFYEGICINIAKVLVDMVGFHMQSSLVLVGAVSAVMLVRYLMKDSMDSKPKHESV
jgi:hypothetical protein